MQWRVSPKIHTFCPQQNIEVSLFNTFTVHITNVVIYHTVRAVDPTLSIISDSLMIGGVTSDQARTFLTNVSPASSQTFLGLPT